MTACCVGVLGLGSGSRVQVDYIWFLLFVEPSSSALFLPLWADFQHETLPLVSGLTRGRPCLYLSTTRSLSRPVHTCSSGSLHHFQLVQLLLRSSPLQENMIIELLALFTHQLRNMFWQVGRTFSGAEAAAGSGSDSFTATGTRGNIQTRGGAKTHISMITIVTLSYVKSQVQCEGVSDVFRCRTCERSPLVHVYDSWTCPEDT